MGTDHREPPTWTDLDEGRHLVGTGAAWREEWAFGFWSDDGRTGGYTGLTVVGDGRTTWYWAALVRADQPLLHVCELGGPALRSSRSLLLKAEGLWAEHECEAPFEQWTVANECFAVALDDPDEIYGRGYGVSTPVAFDLEWYATGPPLPIEGGYEQSGTVHAVIELVGEALRGEYHSRRTHRWGTWNWGNDAPVAGQRAPLQVANQRVERVLTVTGWVEWLRV
jgi:hypothetical protein